MHNSGLIPDLMPPCVPGRIRIKKINKLVDKEDDKRLNSIKQMFLQHGYKQEKAFIRARVLYFTQIGYYALDIQESMDTRLSLFAPYIHAFTGIKPTRAQINRAKKQILSALSAES